LDTIIGKRIPVANETRWCTRSKILNFVALNLNKLIEVMQNIMDNPESGIESINGAKGFINSLKKFDFVFFLWLCLKKYLISLILCMQFYKSSTWM